MWAGDCKLRTDDHVAGLENVGCGPRGGNTIFALVVIALLAWRMPSLLAWMTPVLAGLLLAIPLSHFTASRRFGLRARSQRLVRHT